MNSLNNTDLRSKIEENIVLVVTIVLLTIFLALYVVHSRSTQRAKTQEELDKKRRSNLIMYSIIAFVLVLVVVILIARYVTGKWFSFRAWMFT